MPELEQLPDEHMLRAYGVLLLKPRHRLIRRLQRLYEPSVHGHRTWDSSYLIMDYLEHHPLEAGRRRVLDVGCGWGPVSICAALYEGAEVTGLDVDEAVFPYMEVQAALNEVAVTQDQRSFEKLTTRELEDFDIILSADTCFWEELVRPWQNFIRRAFRAGVRRIVLADPGRDPFEQLADWCRERYNADFMQWYAVEPRRFEGNLLVVEP